ncbi:hypothetical protein [Pelistega europaea]|uniref:Uncharacterized protein n=1 Tax=Pelistega europaea TaxID=106147 RepID=A0A7Y4L900_9BURK|nr:hypothetical protein [Pelistega europaea]NOL49204.1 hypothetical protein [Pelistega europaea]
MRFWFNRKSHEERFHQFFGKSVSKPNEYAPYVIVNDNGSVRPNFDNQEVLENFREILQKAKALRKKLTAHNPT